MGFSRQEYWSGLPFPTPGDLPDPGIKPMSFYVSWIADGFFTIDPPGKPIKLLYNPAIPLLGIYPEETIIEKDIYIRMFTAALFTVARTWKQPRCPLADEWKRKLWCIYTMEYYSAMKKECIWVSSNEVDETGAYYTGWSKSESETPIQYINTYIWNLERQ